MEVTDYLKTNKVIATNIGKLVKDLILSGHCDEFDGVGYNTYIEDVEYVPGIFDLLFVQVSPQEDGSSILEVYTQSKDESLSGFAPFEQLSADVAIQVYNQVKAHSKTNLSSLRKTMIDNINKKLKEADINTLEKVLCGLERLT